MPVSDDGLDQVVLSFDLTGPAMATIEMKQELQLTEEQYAHIERLNAERFTKLEIAEASFARNPDKRASEVKSIHLQSDRSLQAILTEQQLRQYQVLEGRYDIQLISEKEGE